jgi:hypothetical protein
MILDTAFLVDIIRGVRAAGARARGLEGRGEFLRVPAPAVFELWEGVERSNDPPAEQLRVAALLERYPVMDLNRRHATRAGRLSGSLLRRGVVLGEVDLLIAGTALEENEPLLTRNVKDFERVPDLRV